MKKVFSKMVAFAFILCASLTLFACGFIKDKNIKSIALVGEMPEYIVIGQFDQANIKILVTYDDNSSEEVKVTSSMIAEEDRHYLSEEGVYNVTILFKGEETVLTVKMVSAESVNLVKFYDGYGRFIMSELVLEGEDAEGPNADWLTINGYSFIGWDRTITGIVEDTNVYGIYSKIEDAGLSNEELKAKLITANKYFEEHDHVVSMITVENDYTYKQNLNYHYNDGNYSSQLVMGEEGSDDFGIANMDKNGYTVYLYDNDDPEYYEENVQKVDISKAPSYYNTMLLPLALTGNAEMPSISYILENYTATYSTALYGNRDLYTVEFVEVVSNGDDPSANVTIVYDDEKILKMTYQYSYGDGEKWTDYMYIDYSTVAHKEYNFDSKINLDSYKANVEHKLSALKYLDWTASQYIGNEDETYTLTHIANSDIVTVVDTSATINLTDLIPSFNTDSFLVDAGIEGENGTRNNSVEWYTENSMAEYQFNDKGFVSIEVELEDGSYYEILFDEYELLYGDANLDGVVNMQDTVTINQHLAETSELTGLALVVADVNLDGNIDSLDVNILRKYLSTGWGVVSLPCSFLIGDANQDGIISTRDVTAITKHIDGTEILTDMALTCADVNMDNEIDIVDITIIFYYVGHWDIELPYETNVVYGDVNLDGTVDSSDAEILRDYLDESHVNGICKFTFDQILNADMNKDGNVDEEDYALLNE